MCERCGEIDRKIEQYRFIRSTATDSLAVELLEMVVEDLQSEKDALHGGETAP